MRDESRGLPIAGRAGEGAAADGEADIRRLVVAFYDAARVDDMIGPVFDAVTDWDSHYTTMCDFWSSAVLKTGRYAGRPASAHFGLGLTEPHFDRWLETWERVAVRELGETKAEPFIDMGRRMARGMMNVTGMMS